MTDRPILFSAEMVRAILDGRKTQTRRTIKPVPTVNGVGAIFDEGDRQEDFVKPYWVFPETCKYGKPGDLLWVRETWAKGETAGVARYRATDPQCDDTTSGLRWRPSIHMPRWASRITLRITDIRVERLHDISEDDARAEGATMRPACNGFQHRYPGWSMDWSKVGQLSHYATGAKRGVKAPLTEGDVSLHSPKWAFASLWNEINGPGAWDENPWVWVISFERVKP
jgi:hypothetical protein